MHSQLLWERLWDAFTLEFKTSRNFTLHIIMAIRNRRLMRISWCESDSVCDEYYHENIDVVIIVSIVRIVGIPGPLLESVLAHCQLCGRTLARRMPSTSARLTMLPDKLGVADCFSLFRLLNSLSWLSSAASIASIIVTGTRGWPVFPASASQSVKARIVKSWLTC